MNISIIGPENSGKSTLAAEIAKNKRVNQGRPIYIVEGERSGFKKIDISQWAFLQDAVVIMDDANAFFDSYDLQRKENKPMKRAVFKSRWLGRINIFIFHSLDDSVKLFLRQSKFIYVSDRYKSKRYQKWEEFRDISPTRVGRKNYEFLSFQRF